MLSKPVVIGNIICRFNVLSHKSKDVRVDFIHIKNIFCHDRSWVNDHNMTYFLNFH